jgi:hypothetical protein
MATPTRQEVLEEIAVKLRSFFYYDPETQVFKTPEYELWYCVFMRHIDDYLGGHKYGAVWPKDIAENRANALQFIFSHECTSFGIDRDWFIEMVTGAKCQLGLQ